MRFIEARVLCVSCALFLACMPGMALAAWDPDEFDGANVDTTKWSVVNVDHGANNGLVRQLLSTAYRSLCSTGQRGDRTDNNGTQLGKQRARDEGSSPCTQN